MKRIVSLIIGILFLQNMYGQIKKGQPITTKPLVKTRPVSQEVILYEHPNYSGRFKTLGVGQYPLSDFNDLGSSITVPAGMVVVIYEHAKEAGGYGIYVDLMEDCPDLSIYNFNGKASYVNVFRSSSNTGLLWARNRIDKNLFIPGHWERARANGIMPDNSPPAVVSSLSQTGFLDDYSNAPLASQAEIDEFNDIRMNQMNVAVLEGETTKPFYYHHNQPAEELYRYYKIIDPARLPGGFFNWASEKLGWAGLVVEPLESLTDYAGDIKDWLFGSGSTKMKMDCWYPVSELKKTVCGKMKEDVFICPQDYMHTQVTIDKDVCLSLVPSERFNSMLSNRWTGETHDDIEGEVKAKNVANFNPALNKTIETLTPLNPLLQQIKKDENVCLYGPWMGDILDISLKFPIPFTNAKMELANINVRKSNEIHPINQLWRRIGNEIQLIAIADETGYFQKTGNGEVAASGLNQRMRFYIAFSFPANPDVMTGPTLEYHINGVGFEFTHYPVQDIQPEIITLKNNGVVRVKINDNSFVRAQKTHTVFFEKVRKRADGSLQGYIVVETERITKPGGSINIFVKDVTVNNSPADPVIKPPVSDNISSPQGTLHKSFGESGIVVNPERSTYTHLLPLNNGKFMAVDYGNTYNNYGTFRYSIFWRYNADGTLDKSFGQNGKRRWISSDNVYQYFTLVIPQPDGKILAVDNERNQIWRLDGNAQLDQAFGVKGIASFSLLGYSSFKIKSITLDQQNRIIVSGHATQGNRGVKNRLFIARLNSNGIPDETFNNTGYKIVIETTELDYDGVFCTTDRNNDIIVAVEAGIRQQPGFQSFINKYKSTGPLDLGFGQQGSVSVNSIFFSLLADQNSKIIFLAGGDVKRLNPNGSLDKIIFQKTPGSTVSINKLFLQPGNKLVATGGEKPASRKYWNVYVSRFTADGNIDPSFGTGGFVSTDLNFDARAENIHYYDNRLFVSGYMVVESIGYGLILAYDAPNSIVNPREKIDPKKPGGLKIN